MSSIQASDTEKQQITAKTLLRWIEENITRAPEYYLKRLSDEPSITVLKNSLSKIAQSGEELEASALFSIDGNRLNYLHKAATQNSADANQNTLISSKLMNLEHQIIDSDLVHYTVALEATPPTSRLDRNQAAQALLSEMEAMKSGNQPGQGEVVAEPMMRVFAKSLQLLMANNELISQQMIAAMENNAAEKEILAQSPLTGDITHTQSSHYFTVQATAYKKFAKHAKEKQLVAGASASPAKAR